MIMRRFIAQNIKFSEVFASYKFRVFYQANVNLTYHNIIMLKWVIMLFINGTSTLEPLNHIILQMQVLIKFSTDKS